MGITLGPRTQRAYEAVRQRILVGELAPGAQLPSFPALAAQLGVAPMTMHQALVALEEEGLVERAQGRGTFVRANVPPGVLVVDDEDHVRALLRASVQAAGYRAVEAANPTEGLAALAADGNITLVLSDIRMPATADGIEFIRTVRRRWPQVPLAAVTRYPEDLEELLDTREWPLLVLPKPFRQSQLHELLRLTQPSGRGPRREGRPMATGINTLRGHRGVQ